MVIRLPSILTWGLLIVWGCVSLDAADNTEFVAPEKTIRKFKELDRDSSGQLSVDEYVARRDPVPVHTRDFKLFDVNHDGVLSLVEFAPIARGTHGDLRGPIPDPMVTVVDDVAADMGRRLKNWNDRASEEVTPQEFLNALSLDLSVLLNSRLVQQADENRNGKISRSEARRFLEIQFGLRLPNGRPLRTPNGRINNYSFFLYLDRNLNQQIELAEIVAAAGNDAYLKNRFTDSDKDGDNILSQDEWFIANWPYYDPIEDFRHLDSNLDAYLDENELVKGITDWRKTGLKFLICAYDDDRDGKMSINEYRLTPLSNIIFAWQKIQTDENTDQQLAINEFTFEQPYFQMLRTYYFRRFDLNKDGYLDLSEYEFKTVRPFEMYTMKADGTGLKKLDVGKNVRFGSPSVSPDGLWIAFDGTDEYKSGYQKWQVQIMPLSGGEPKAVCEGVQPTWSKDSLNIACCRFQPMYGIWIMNVAGTSSEFVGTGWGTQWSPDGKKIYFNNGNVMRIYDVETKTTEDLLNPQQHEYTSFDMNATWSPDSNRICVNARKAATPDISDVVIVDTTEENRGKFKIRLSGKQIASDFAWHPDGRRIIFAMFCEERHRRQFYQFDPEATGGAVSLVPGQIESKSAIDSTWTPDGAHLVFNVGDDI